MDEETTNPAEGVDAPEAEVEEVQDAEPQLDEYGNPVEEEPEPEPEEELEDVERDGKTYRIPKALKPELMMQGDYTRKTQELAETRKAVEAERELVQQARQMTEAEINLRSQKTAYASQHDAILADVAKQYGSWDAYFDADPFEAQKARARLDEARHLHQQADHHLGVIERERTSKQQQAANAERQAIATLREQGTPELKKAIPDWSPTRAEAIVKEASQRFSIPIDDLDGADKPGHYLILDAAMKWMDHQAKTKKAQAVQTQTELKPAAKVGGAAPKTGLDDRLSTAEWVRRRNAQARKRA